MIDYGYGVSLDVLDPREVERYRNWRNNYMVWRWCRQNKLITRDEQSLWFERQSKDPKIQMFEVWDTANLDHHNEARGVCGLTSIDLVNKNAEFSFYLAPECQGLGYSKPGLKTLFSYGFLELGLKSIWGETFEDNKAQHIFLSLGMMEEGRRRQFYFKNGKFTDAIMFSMLDTEFIQVKESW